MKSVPPILPALLMLALSGCGRVNDSLFEYSCEHNLAPASVEVRATQAAPIVDSHFSVAELTAKYSPIPGARTLGLTEAMLNKSISLSYSGKTQLGTGRICSRPQVKVDLSFSPMTVYIAKGYPKGSCKYKEIYEHEQRHVAAYNAFINSSPDEVKKNISQVLGNKILYLSSEEAATTSLDKVLESALMPYLDQKMSEIGEEQRKIDTLEEYERLSRVCPGEYDPVRFFIN